MGTKVISISEGVYTKLDAERWKGESFDEVITRLTKKKGSSLFCMGNSISLLSAEADYMRGMLNVERP